MFRRLDLNRLHRLGALPLGREWLAVAAVLVLAARHGSEQRGAFMALPFALTWLAVTVEFLLGFVAMRAYLAQRLVRGRRVYLLVLFLAAVIVVGPRLLMMAVHAARIWQFLLPPVGVAGALVAWRVTKPVRGPTLILLVQVLVLWGLVDLPVVTHARLYDLNTYLASGAHALAGTPVYLDHAMVAPPATASEDIFLYPPPLIPLLEAAALLPYFVVAVVWVAVLVLAGVIGFRLLGLGWHWGILFMAFPPIVDGIRAGNVANIVFLLFALGYRYGWPMFLGVFFKVQSIVPVAWLVRERRWRPLLVGAGVVTTIVLVTLPVVGLQSWRDWAAGLLYRQQSQVNLPLLFGASIARQLPPLVYVAVSVAAIGAALVARGRRGLAALGIATIIASPSLWPHGFVMALPALFGVRWAALVWLALGLPPGTVGLWAMTGLAIGALLLPGWGRRIDQDLVHPLSGTEGPWASEPAARRSAGPPASRTRAPDIFGGIDPSAPP